MFSTLVTPRFGDIDGLRHVTNTVLPIWFEQARNEFYFYFNTELNFEKWNLLENKNLIGVLDASRSFLDRVEK